MSKVSKTKGKYYPIRRPKERPRNLLEELLEQERKQRSKELKESRIRIIKDITSNDIVYSHLNITDGMSKETFEVGE